MIRLNNNLVDKIFNVKLSFVNLIVENIPISFEADSGFAQSTISVKLY